MSRTMPLQLFAHGPEFTRRVVDQGLLAILDRANAPDMQLVLALANGLIGRNLAVFNRALSLARIRLDDAAPADYTADQRVMAVIANHPDPWSIIQTRYTREEGLLLRLNPLRGLRPNGYQQTSAPVGFFRRIIDERFWFEWWDGHVLGFYSNKFPCGPDHFLVVPQLDRVQRLTEADVGLMWALYEQGYPLFPDLIVGYNSEDGYATQPDIHIQIVLSGAGVAGVSALLRPVACFSPGHLWQVASALQAVGQPFNVVFYRQRALVVPRVRQGTEKPLPGNTGFAYWELAGGIPLTKPRIYAKLTDAPVRAVYRSLVPAAVRLPERVLAGVR